MSIMIRAALTSFELIIRRANGLNTIGRNGLIMLRPEALHQIF